MFVAPSSVNISSVDSFSVNVSMLNRDVVKRSFDFSIRTPEFISSLNKSEFTISIEPFSYRNLTLTFNVDYLGCGNLSLIVQSGEYVEVCNIEIFWDYQALSIYAGPSTVSFKVSHQSKIFLTILNPFDKPCKIYMETETLGFGLKLVGPNETFVQLGNNTFEYIVTSEVPGNATVEFKVYADAGRKLLAGAESVNVNVAESRVEKLILEIFGYKIDLTYVRLFIKFGIAAFPFIIRISKRTRKRIKKSRALALSVLLFIMVTVYYVYFRDTLDSILEILIKIFV